MLELLRDPLWQFVGAMFAVAALAASFVIYQLQRSRRGITYDVLSRTDLLTVREELEGKLQVLYEGEPAKSLTLIVLRFWNSGNQPILATDFERPISFCTGQASRLLSAAVTQVEPPELMVDVEVAENILVINPTLLNSGDAVTLKLLVRDSGSVLCPDARIVGVKSVRRAGDGSRLFLFLATTGMVLLAIGFYLFIANVPRSENKPPLPTSALTGVAISLLGYGILIYLLLNFRKYRVSLVRLVRLVRFTSRG